jgi:hypothetical protein
MKLSDYLNAPDTSDGAAGQAVDTLRKLCHECRTGLDAALVRSEGEITPSLYAVCCERHAPYLRVAADPAHLEWVRANLGALTERHKQLDASYDSMQRIEQGSALLGDPEKQYTEAQIFAYRSRIQELMNKVSPDFRDWESTKIKTELDLTYAAMVYYWGWLRRATNLED